MPRILDAMYITVGGSELEGIDAPQVGVLQLSINSGTKMGLDPLNAAVAAPRSPLAVNTDDAGDDDAALLTAPVIALCGVTDLFTQPAVPVLPTPPPSTPWAQVATPGPDRRSCRLAAKPILPAIDKAVRVLHKKMGLDVGDMPLVQATKVFANSLKTPLSGSAIYALSTLFKLNLPSMSDTDEALIALAGSGGSDFPTPVARGDSI